MFFIVISFVFVLKLSGVFTGISSVAFVLGFTLPVITAFILAAVLSKVLIAT